MSARGNDRVLVAFDPGISGAAAFHTVETSHLLTAEDSPVVAGQVDAVSLANRLSEMKSVAAFVERVAAMPKQDVLHVQIIRPSQWRPDRHPGGRRITTKLRPASWRNSARGYCAKARCDA